MATRKENSVLLMVVFVVVCIMALLFIAFVLPGIVPSDVSGVITEKKNFQSKLISVPLIALDLSTFNGYVVISPDDVDMVAIEATIKGPQDELKEISFDFQEQVSGGLKTVTLKVEKNIFISSSGVSLSVIVPKNKNWDINAETSNGRIEILRLEGRNLNVQTSNGEINLDTSDFEVIDATTSNAQIRGSISSEKASLETSNGRIEMKILTYGQYKLTTSNSRINVELQYTPIKVEASTSNGEIQWNGPTLTLVQSSKTKLSGHTQDYDATEPNIDLSLGTSNGDISILYSLKD